MISRSAHIEHHATRDEWLAARTIGFRIGGSAVPRILMEEHPYGNGPWSVWAEHHDPQPYEPSTDYQEAGITNEPLAVALYAQRTGAPVEHTPDTLLVNEGLPWVVCSPDGLVGRAGGVEVKHYAHPEWSEWAPSGTSWSGSGPFPCGRYVALQACWSLAASGRLWWDAIVNLPSGGWYPDMRVYRFWRDEVYLAEMVARVSEWRERHLVGGERPPYDSGDQHYAIVGRRHPRRLRKDVLDATETDEDLLRRLADASHREDVAAAEVKLLRAEIAARIGDNAGLKGTAGRVSWGDPRPTRSLALSRVEERAPEIAAELLRRGLITIGETSRTFRFTPAKAGK